MQWPFKLDMLETAEASAKAPGAPPRWTFVLPLSTGAGCRSFGLQHYVLAEEEVGAPIRSRLCSSLRDDDGCVCVQAKQATLPLDAAFSATGSLWANMPPCRLQPLTFVNPGLRIEVLILPSSTSTWASANAIARLPSRVILLPDDRYFYPRPSAFPKDRESLKTDPCGLS